MASSSSHDRGLCQESGVSRCIVCDDEFRATFIDPSTGELAAKWSDLIYEHGADRILGCGIGYNRLAWGGKDQRLYVRIDLAEGVRSKFVAEALFESDEGWASMSWTNVVFLWPDDDRSSNSPSASASASLPSNDDDDFVLVRTAPTNTPNGIIDAASTGFAASIEAAAASTTTTAAAASLSIAKQEEPMLQPSDMEMEGRLLAQIRALKQERDRLQEELRASMKLCEYWAMQYMGTGRGEDDGDQPPRDDSHPHKAEEEGPYSFVWMMTAAAVGISALCLWLK